ncbi:MAG TPA: hypothetical protein VNO18_19170 [Xanthobacteraceae bacterium]|jgi:hypothetical protein|nr:hypothetical protein [Xanthobacteraceae bacterium]
MRYRSPIGSRARVAAPLAALLLTIAGAHAFDETKYPDLKGQWDRTAAPRWLDAKSAPFTPEYRAIFEENLKDQAAGGQGTDPTFTCLAPGMPRVMNMYAPFEIVVTPRTTHMLMDHIHDSRRIFTDGRDWPKEIQPSFSGYSIGKWIDEDGDGRYDVLVVETRGLQGPRAYDSTGMPFHSDNETVINERIYLDNADKNTLYDEITVTDHALTKPWTAVKKYVRKPDKQPVWREAVCAENNPHVVIADEPYMLSADGFLMPAKKDQAPPDLKYFPQSRK